MYRQSAVRAPAVPGCMDGVCGGAPRRARCVQVQRVSGALRRVSERWGGVLHRAELPVVEWSVACEAGAACVEGFGSQTRLAVCSVPGWWAPWRAPRVYLDYFELSRTPAPAPCSLPRELRMREAPAQYLRRHAEALLASRAGVACSYYGAAGLLFAVATALHGAFTRQAGAVQDTTLRACLTHGMMPAGVWTALFSLV